MKDRSYFKQKDDAYIFTTGVGLILTLGMVFLMVIVILVKALGFFWPANLQLVNMKNGDHYLGEQYEKESSTTRGESGEQVKKQEVQFKIGNRDVYGHDFIWLNRENIQAIQLPANATAFEREEYGAFFGFMQTLQFQSNQYSETSIGNQEFLKRTQQAHEIARQNQDKISSLEDELNELMEPLTHVNREISLLEISIEAKTEAGKKKLEQMTQNANRLEQSIADEYQRLSTELQRLRSMNQNISVVVRTAGGNQRTIQLGQVVRLYQPNRMNAWNKSVMYAARLWEFISAEPRESNTEGGVFPAIFGTVMMVLIMSIAVVPFGVMAAIYLNEYAHQGTVIRLIRLSVNNLAGVPSIVFGIFGLGFFIYIVGGSIDQLFFSDKLPQPTFGTGGILWASLTLALLTVPVVVVATEEGLLAVPKANKDGALALGATRWQMIRRIVLPNAMPGILTGLILAISRGAGEVAPLMITGVVKLAPALPIDSNFPFVHLDRKFMHLGFHIYDVGFQSPNVEAAKPMVYATALLLIAIVVLLNLLAIFLRNRLRKKYKTATF